MGSETERAMLENDGMRDERAGGVTPRAVLVAFALLILIAVGAFYVEIAWNKIYMFASGVPAMAPVVLLFVLTGVAGIPALRRAGLTRRELLTVYCITLVGGPLVSHGVLFWMLPKVIAYYYVARVQPLWETTFLPFVPASLAPTDPLAAEAFFQGHAQVPWQLWWAPLGSWGTFFFALFICTLCAVVLIQRQWITNERLTFPIAQIPLEMVRAPAGQGRSAAGRLPVAWVFWVGLGASLFVNFMNSLSNRVPAIPAIPLGPVAIIQWQKVGPWAGLGQIDLVLWPWMIAVAYLIPKELSFSAWFFWVMRLALTVAAVAAGHTPQRPEDWYESGFPAPYFQGGGAALALFIWVLWVARRHIRQIFRIASSHQSGRADDREPLTYRLALIGFLLSFGFMVYFCWAAGCRIVFGLVLIGMIVGYYVMWARLRAETGLGFLPFPLEIQSGLTSLVGTASLRPREVVTMISTRWAYFPGFGESSEVITGNVLESIKIADSARINSRRLTRALVAGLLLSLVVGVFVILVGCHTYGYFGLGMGGAYGWPSWQTRNDGGRIFEFLTNPAPPDTNAIAAMVGGAAVAVLLGAMRLRFWWWPFHPIGYMAANCWGMHWYYMPFFLGWAFKSLVIRYGGLRLYRATVPLAIGLIVGDLVNQGVWSVVAVVTQGRV